MKVNRWYKPIPKLLKDNLVICIQKTLKINMPFYKTISHLRIYPKNHPRCAKLVSYLNSQPPLLIREKKIRK